MPSTYNYNQHNVPEADREAYGLSTNVYRRTDYDKLVLSLTSPLPNEQDFAINVCTLLSNEGRHTLKLAKCPRLLDLLLGHAGVFNHFNLLDYLNGLYKEARKYDLMAFWKDVCRDPSVLELLLIPMSRSLKSADKGEKSSRKSSSKKPATGAERLAALMSKAQSEMSHRDESGLFASGHNLGTHELAGQRVMQIATIIRNLSFEDENIGVLAKNLTCLRFCLLCASSEWSNLNQMGFDILSNVASDIVVEEATSDSCVNEVLLSTLTSSISSTDRFQVISSLEILNKLCIQEANEDVIETMLAEQTSRVYDKLVTYLSLHDIHLLISTLECLYSLSCLGESTCNSIVRTHGAVEALVSLVTVEAQSYGPKACILMRVVETVHKEDAATAAARQQQQLQLQQQQQQQLAALKPVPVSTPTAAAGGQQMVRSQLVQIQRPGVQLPQQPLPPQQIRPQSPQIQQQQRIVPQQQQPAVVAQQQVQQPQQHQVQQLTQVPQQTPTTPNQQPQQVTKQIVVQATTANGQPQQLIITSQNPNVTLNKGMTILTTTTAQPQPQQPQLIRSQAPLLQPQQQQQQQQMLQQLRPQAQPPQLQPQQQQPAGAQQPPQQQPPPPPQQQQVQLRVSNDEVNRQFCLSWLKATYETVNGSSIEQQVMYKQYLASLHKLGKKDVISAQHYAVCVR